MAEKIMVVDDEADIRRLITKRLTAAKYDVVSYPTAVEALKVLQEEAPDLVLMDVNMPEMDGFEACKRFTEMVPSLPVLFVSARGDVDDKIIAFESGGRDYIPKPFSPAELVARVKATLREKSLKDAAQKKAETFEILAITDPLTGIANRRYFDERLKEELGRSRRYNSDLSCAMVDIDNFKAVNDTYGHAVGDRVIVEVVNAIRQSIRAVDMPARYGGEEFVILLPQTDLSEATLLGERIRRSVEEIRLGPGMPNISVSIGVAMGSEKDLVENADKGLYQAKRAGKNRVIAVTPGPKED